MSLWVLDTDSISLLQRGHPIISQRVNRVNPEQIAITIITVEEQLRGRMDIIRRATSSDMLTLAYTRLRDTVEDFKSINIINFEPEASSYYTDLLHQRIRIGTQDLRIAAIAISRKAILVTRNRRDFEKVPGLVFEDWTV
ncbi:MAG TPA: nucleic acid-binding protein [Cyanobacteria bacterium UBA11149]|nr:nucleic acid-binding protein [Cyanobacteria bacterium UBA11366]HBK66311.1 nucleic acid-binding protein [Cyanobacteria bacterium UBA11166]HBR77220.1 nucleic acid-binding protein [Cyanobacteria bacterium UBA11159]HBS72262.1 nucleic acid-binding protein [Cyanobacteria bacterium UBA11153]HBW87660.1 nucleic acid-binding protein [Cyanobacteria bacterium UBA11149]HCA96656.1 nucleic acid-binding protein [Cyanobacteria bacterium UBA9226]